VRGEWVFGLVPGARTPARNASWRFGRVTRAGELLERSAPSPRECLQRTGGGATRHSAMEERAVSAKRAGAKVQGEAVRWERDATDTRFVRVEAVLRSPSGKPHTPACFCSSDRSRHACRYSSTWRPLFTLFWRAQLSWPALSSLPSLTDSSSSSGSPPRSLPLRSSFFARVPSRPRGTAPPEMPSLAVEKLDNLAPAMFL
jgi:hypothetical protein